MTQSRVHPVRRWVRRGFVVWAVVSMSWLANSVRTQGVADELLQSSDSVSVADQAAVVELLPRRAAGAAALLFISGAGVHAHAYVPLLRPIAEAGFAVFIVKLPYRFAPLDSHKQQALERASGTIATHREIARWVVAGHSLGGAIAARLARAEPGLDAEFVLIGTTHPRDDDLSGLRAPFTKIYATNDGVAPVDRVMANKHLLPPRTDWVEIAGGNHSQFGHYGHQLFDGRPAISREAQQSITRETLLEALSSSNR